ncbi:MAG: hypothetical protein AAFR26_12715 [Cyanobacteria bacterium J06626_4]
MPAAPAAMVEQLSGLISWYLTRPQTSPVFSGAARTQWPDFPSAAGGDCRIPVLKRRYFSGDAHRVAVGSDRLVSSVEKSLF